MRKFVLFLLFCLIARFIYADTIMVQVRFKEETSYGEYNDVLYFTQSEYSTVKQEDIDTLKQKRVDNWIYSKEHPPIYIEPTLEILKAYKAELNDQLNIVQLKILEKEAEIIK